MLLARCYANFYWLFKDVFHVDVPALNLVQTFGFFVALAFLTAALFLYTELKRRERLGLFKPYQYMQTIGEPAKPLELILNFILGFIIGFKVVGVFMNMEEVMKNPQVWMLSTKGSLVGGIVFGAILSLQKWYEKHKERLPEPRKEMSTMWPHDMIGDIVLMAAIGGIGGAKLFYLFESPGNFTEFLKDPFGSFFGGLTIFGGIICGTIVVLSFARRRNINMLQLCDAVAPTLLIALAVGRIGCQTAGDGDWGINNTFAKPGFLSWLPDWMWAYDYSHNVNRDGSGFVQGCHEAYCTYVIPPVFPTPIYEIIACTLLFILLWSLRKRIHALGVMFSLYLFVSGIERITIEQIRVNTKLNILGIEATQAEIIAVLFIIIGIAGMFIFTARYRKRLKEGAPAAAE